MKKLDLTSRDVELIENALHTQTKILSVQSEAGAAAAREKLQELKHLIRRVGRARKRSDGKCRATWADWVRSYFLGVCS